MDGRKALGQLMLAKFDNSMGLQKLEVISLLIPETPESLNLELRQVVVMEL